MPKLRTSRALPSSRLHLCPSPSGAPTADSEIPSQEFIILPRSTRASTVFLTEFRLRGMIPLAIAANE
jgi:hypothetical protein